MSASSVNGSKPVTRIFCTPAANRVLVIRRTEGEVRLPLPEGEGHRDARPVEAAVVGGGECVGLRLRVLRAVGRRTPESFALGADEDRRGSLVGR